MNKRPEEQRPGDAGGEAADRDQSERRDVAADESARPPLPREIGGRDGPEPTRYGDWEKNGRCIDF